MELKPNYWKEILNILEEASVLGTKKMPNGTLLIGNVKHVAPMAYFHGIFPPLIDQQISIIESDIGHALPTALIEFYKIANGISLFSDSLSIEGYRENYISDIENALSQPYDITTANVPERICDASDDMVFFGSYETDGSKLYIKASSETVYRCSPETVKPLNEWPSFSDMLLSEVKRLSGLFDSEGKKIDKAIPTCPDAFHLH